MNARSRHHTPEQILADPQLDRERKIALLRGLEYDARELSVAVEEGMPGADPQLLQGVQLALAALGAGPTGPGAPTKQGG